MGRHRVEIKKIENKAIRQVTFAKRRNGLLKKAYEISALCDIEVALLAFSPSGKPTIFGGKKRFDQILARYINLPEHQERGLEDLESLHRLIDGMRRERNMYNHRRIGDEMYADAQMEEIQREMNIVGNQFEEVMTQLKYYEEIPSYIRTVSEMEAYEEFLRQTLNQVQMQKQALQTNQRAPQLVQNYFTTPLLEKLDVEVARGDQMLTGGGHGNMSRAMGVAGGGGTVGGNPTAMAMGGNSIYNTTNSNLTHVPATSMLNFLNSNGSSTRNMQGQYMNNNGLLPHPPSFLADHQVTERNFSGRLAPIKESEEMRNYYLDLARRLGLPLPHEQNQTGRGGPGGGAGSTSGQASFQATRDPRSG